MTIPFKWPLTSVLSMRTAIMDSRYKSTLQFSISSVESITNTPCLIHQVENALLVVAYPTGRPADVMMLDRKKCEKYWFDWLKRLEKFNLLKGR